MITVVFVMNTVGLLAQIRQSHCSSLCLHEIGESVLLSHFTQPLAVAHYQDV